MNKFDDLFIEKNQSIEKNQNRKSKSARPTNIDNDLYIKFGNKCRTNGQNIGKTLQNLLKEYIKHGDFLFKK
jgi:hypothetical protein